MKKLVLKTTLYTVIAVLVLIGISILVLTIFSPKTLALFNHKLGNKGLSVYYSELQYNKTEDLDDLETLLYIINDANDYKKNVQYSKTMLESDGFEDFAKIVDGGSGEYEFYVVSKYAVALYYEGVEKAEIFTIVEGYLDNPTQIETIQLVINNLQ